LALCVSVRKILYLKIRSVYVKMGLLSLIIVVIAIIMQQLLVRTANANKNSY